MNYAIDESHLLAGMVIRIGDRVVDSSIKHKIDELAREFKEYPVIGTSDSLVI